MNEYLKIFREKEMHTYFVPGEFDVEKHYAKYVSRRTYTTKYAWAVPTDEALETIAKYGPIVEIGAGTGYWSSLLREMGVDVVAYDLTPPKPETVSNTFHKNTNTWTTVLRGGAPKAAEHSDRALFLCWPPYSERMAYDCLRKYKGNTLIYVGEGRGGCTGCDKFHSLLIRKWKHVEDVQIPQYEGIHDYLEVYQRA